MSSNEIMPNQPQEVAQPTSEIDRTSAELARVPRVVLFGSRTSGRGKAAEFIKDAIKNVPDSEVEIARFVTGIEDAFYGRFTQAEAKAIESIEPLQKSGRLKRVTDLVLRRTVEPPVSSGVIKFEYIKREDTIPSGVVIFPEMRLHDDLSDSFMTVPTPVDAIESLCRQHDVPMAYANNEGDLDQIKQLTQGFST